DSTCVNPSKARSDNSYTVALPRCIAVRALQVCRLSWSCPLTGFIRCIRNEAIRLTATSLTHAFTRFPGIEVPDGLPGDTGYGLIVIGRIRYFQSHPCRFFEINVRRIPTSGDDVLYARIFQFP